MGCSICLDDFDQADGEEKRATALACGHIFHGDCLYQWFYGATANATNRLPNQRRCPLCSKEANPASQIRLYPSDGDDLNTYLSGQRLHELVCVKEDGSTSGGHDAEHARLLNDLLDFNSAMQSYVMATHSVHTDLMLKAGVKIRKFVKDLTKKGTPSAANLKLTLEQAMNGLYNASLQFSSLRNQLERKASSLKMDEMKLQTDKDALKEKLQKAEELLKQGEQAKAAVMDKLSLATAKYIEAAKKEAQNEARDKELQERKKRLDAAERELKHKQIKANRDNSLRISTMQAQLDKQQLDMAARMEAAIRERDEAVKERTTTHSKNCALAQQLRELQEKLKAKASQPNKTQASKSSNGKTTDSAAKDRTIQALRAQIQALQAQLEARGISTPVRRLNRRNSNQRSSQNEFVDLTRSSPIGMDDDFSPATPLDGLPLTSQASAAALPKSPTTPSRRGTKRARTSLSVDPENMEKETDEALFPMPGMPRVGSSVAQPTRQTQPDASDQVGKASSPSRARPRPPQGLASRSLTVRKTPPRGSQKKSEATNNVGGKENDTYGWLNKAVAVQLGPKRKSKA